MSEKVPETPRETHVIDGEVASEDELFEAYYQHRFDYLMYVQRRLREELEPRKAKAGA